MKKFSEIPAGTLLFWKGVLACREIWMKRDEEFILLIWSSISERRALDQEYCGSYVLSASDMDFEDSGWSLNHPE